MPPPSARRRYQVAVYWEATGIDDYGRHTTAAPIEIRVRWNNKAMQRVSPTGNVVSFDASARVDRTMPVGSVLTLGTLENWLKVGSAGSSNDLYEVKEYTEVKDTKARWSERKVMLARYRDAPPSRT